LGSYRDERVAKNSGQDLLESKSHPYIIKTTMTINPLMKGSQEYLPRALIYFSDVVEGVKYSEIYQPYSVGFTTYSNSGLAANKIVEIIEVQS
jgi:hypothetical protein